MIIKLASFLTAAELKRSIVLFFMILTMAFIDVLGVASILPFMTVLTNPDLVHTNIILKNLFQIFSLLGIKELPDFLLALGFMVFMLLCGSLALKAFVTFSQLHFVTACEYSIGKRLVFLYLNQPYHWILNRNSADLGKTILSEVGIVVSNGITPMMTLIAQSAVALALIGLLIAVDPSLAVSVSVVLCLAYALIFFVTSALLKSLGKKRVWANQQRFLAVTEAFGAFKEVKVHGLERVYAERFAKPAEQYAMGQSTARAIGQLPRFFMEAVAFGGLLAVLLFLMMRNDSINSVIPVIALYAFAGYRLMPALQQIYQSYTQLRFVGPAIDNLREELTTLALSNPQNNPQTSFSFERTIQLEQVSYRYPGAPSCTLHSLSLNIPRHSTVGFVGLTGSGKTTCVDVLMGLLEPDEGQLLVDGNCISAENRRQWQSIIGYVPQHIYLADETISENIALGCDAQNIDQEALERAAKIANLHEFVVNDLPDGYATLVGERGVRLSGGQRQRIGIARALYNNPQVLILDEATSALDSVTEQAVMATLEALDQITIILIAHRLTTVQNCDQIYLFEEGKLKTHGTFQELIEKSKDFKSLAYGLQNIQ